MLGMVVTTTKKSRKTKEPLVSIETTNFELEIGKGLRLYFNPVRTVKFFIQRCIRGFDDSELWSLDGTITTFILPRLRVFRKSTQSYPSDLKNIDNWYKILDKMIKSFEYNKSDWSGGIGTYRKKRKEYDEGMQLFAKYYGHLWS